MLAREPQCVDNGDGELRRWKGTKENEALFTALPKVHPCKRFGIIHKFPAPWGCNGNKGSQHKWKKNKPLEKGSKSKLHPSFSLKINSAWLLLEKGNGF